MTMEVCHGMAEVISGLEILVVPIPVTASQITPSAVHIADTPMPARQIAMVIYTGRYTM